MKTFCIISFTNIYILPYIKRYVELVIEAGAKCDIIFWDRDQSGYDKSLFNSNHITMIPYIKKGKALFLQLEKIVGYCEVTKFIRRKLMENDYDGIFFLQTHAAVACVDILWRKYKNRYVVDIRDYTLEKYYFYMQMESYVVNNSGLNVISSPAYTQFLPKSEYIVAHNYDKFPKNLVGNIKNDNDTEEITISFVGSIRFIDINKKLLEIFANNNLFRLEYYGTGSDVLKHFAYSKGIHNAFFKGAFKSCETPLLYIKTDFINNIYGSNSHYLDYAISNRLYHAIQLSIPIIVSKNTYMEKLINEYNIGLAVDIVNDKSIPDLVYNYYINFKKDDFCARCKDLIKKIEKENQLYFKKINSFIKNVI